MPAEERKLATVLFADLVGSTELAGDEDPERVRALLDRFYDAMEDEIARAGGTVEKFVGDAVMAAFGAPVAHEDDAERALHAALGMQRRLGELFGERLALRIGVNTGDVVVGRPREGSSFVTGDAVNVCARLEQGAAPGEILVGERTLAAARGAFEFSEPERIDAKGKAGGVVCARLVRALSLMRPRGVGGFPPVFVGREGELSWLQDAYERATVHGRPQLVTVVGDAGVGKTRLARELWQWLSTQEPRPLLRAGRCLPYGRGITYWPLAEVLKEHFGIVENETPTEDRLGGRQGLGFTLGLAPPEGTHPLTVRERLRDDWVEFLSELSSERAAVILVEDLHWAEDELCDLLESLTERVAGPVLLLTTSRQDLLDRRPGWSGAALRLDALPAADTRHLVTELLGPDCPPSLADLVVGRADGNPFFAEELISTLVDRGVIGRSDGGWSFGELPADFSVPDTVQAVLAARIDLLPPEAKAALQAAAVIGRTFWSGAVGELVGGAPDFHLLEEREFVRRRAGASLAGEDEYAIKHALTREVAYESLLKAKRAPLHAGFAEWLERRGEGEDEHAALLAHHYAEAVRPEDLDLAWAGREADAARLREKALLWSKRAARLAVGRYEMDEGLALLERAVELEPDPAEQERLWQEIGHANALKFDGDAFWKAVERSIELGGPEGELYAELAFQSTRRWGMWKRQPDASLIQDWIDRALELAEQGSRSQAHALYAKSGWSGDGAATQALAAIAERRGEPDLRSLALEELARVAWEAGEVERSRALVAELFELAPRLSDPDDRTRPLLDVIHGFIRVGDLAAAERAASLNVELTRGLTPHHRLHGAGMRLQLQTLAGRWDTVHELAPSGERAVDENEGTPCPQNVTTLLHCALAATYRGDDSEASRLEEKAQAIGMEGWRFWFDPARIRLALARGDLAALPALIEGAEPDAIEPPSALLDAFVALGDRDRIEAEAPKWLRPGTYIEPFALRALGSAREDEALLERAIERFEAMQLEWHVDQTRNMLRGS
ncbi:MAG TPA: adenylate/guanylate cyclase domain-containing protein [Gaiellaceae bacterium]|nr:adenylate/guanylate cyclase domain-containing protein [Gaiellaceae bacterium]